MDGWDVSPSPNPLPQGEGIYRCGDYRLLGVEAAVYDQLGAGYEGGVVRVRRQRGLLHAHIRPYIICRRDVGRNVLQNNFQGEHSMATDLRAVETADDERSIQVTMLPTLDEVAEVVSQLEIGDLREFAIAIMNAAAESARGGGSDLDTIRLLNSWFASMEEIVAAGDDLEEILSRRRTPGNTQ